MPTTPTFPVTVVTALLDVGRKFIPAPHNRTIETYMDWMGFVLSLPCPVIVFTSSDLAPEIKKRRGTKPTEIREISSDAIRDTKLHAKIAQLVSGETNFALPDRPECYLPLHNGVTFRKTEWLRQVAHSNPFQSSYFLWVDAGFGHGRPSSGPHYENWPIRLNQLSDNKVHLMQLFPIPEIEEEARFRAHQVIMSTACFGGSDKAVERLGHTYNLVLNRTLDSGLIDDDQAVMTSVYQQDPRLFTLVGPTYGNRYEMLGYFSSGKVAKNPIGWARSHPKRMTALALGVAGFGYLLARKRRNSKKDKG